MRTVDRLVLRGRWEQRGRVMTPGYPEHIGLREELEHFS